VIVLDIEMPNMDGLTALPQLRKLAPQAKHRDGVDASPLPATHQTVKALSLGAADFIAKPQASAMGAVDSYRRELIDKIIALGPRIAMRSGSQLPAPVALRIRPAIAGRPSVMVGPPRRPGGPGALPIFLGQIARRIDAPILIVQHMPATFTPVFAEKLESTIGKRCREAVDGDVLAGSVYLAPGDYHMRIARSSASSTVHARQESPREFLPPRRRPAVRVRRPPHMATASSAWCLPAWAMTAAMARARSSRPAAASSSRTKPRALSGACRARSRRQALLKP